MLYLIGYSFIGSIVFFFSMLGFKKCGDVKFDDFDIVMPSILIAVFWPLTIWFAVAYFIYKYLENKK